MPGTGVGDGGEEGDRQKAGWGLRLGVGEGEGQKEGVGLCGRGRDRKLEGEWPCPLSGGLNQGGERQGLCEQAPTGTNHCNTQRSGE